MVLQLDEIYNFFTVRAERILSRGELEKKFYLGEDQNKFFPNIIIASYILAPKFREGSIL